MPTQFRATPSSSRRAAAFWPKLVGIVLLAGLLWSCADDSGPSSGPAEDRRFANEPSTARATVATPVTASSTAAPVVAEQQASPESLLATRGAPTIVFTLVDGSIQVVDIAAQRITALIEAPASYRFVAVAQSPSGDQMAAILGPLADPVSSRPEVAIYDSAGAEVKRWSDLPGRSSSGASPIAEIAGSAMVEPSISWAPSGDRLLVTLDGSQIVSLEADGSATLVPMPASFAGIAQAAWSPRGDQIAILAHDEDGTGIIWVFAPYVDGESLRQVAPPNTDAANLGSVSRFSWLPDNSGLVYILADEASADPTGGQLFSNNIRLGVKLVVATPGRGGPTAQIQDFTVSPDGQAVAYTIAIPVGDGWQVHSLWVRSLQDGIIYSVPIRNATVIDRLWFVRDGIAWRQTIAGESELVTHTAGVSNSVIPLLPADTATPGASPASPTPVASPVTISQVASSPTGATPGATPNLATPVAATPVLATPRASPALD